MNITLSLWPITALETSSSRFCRWTSVLFRNKRESPLTVRISWSLLGSWKTSACVSGGISMSNPFCSSGVTTMKMMRSTRQTSTSGVTLMSDFTSPAPPLPTCMGSHSLSAHGDVLLLNEEVHDLRRGVVHLQDEVVD